MRKNLTGFGFTVLAIFSFFGCFIANAKQVFAQNAIIAQSSPCQYGPTITNIEFGHLYIIPSQPNSVHPMYDRNPQWECMKGVIDLGKFSLEEIRKLLISQNIEIPTGIYRWHIRFPKGNGIIPGGITGKGIYPIKPVPPRIPRD